MDVTNISISFPNPFLSSFVLPTPICFHYFISLARSLSLSLFHPPPSLPPSLNLSFSLYMCSIGNAGSFGFAFVFFKTNNAMLFFSIYLSIYFLLLFFCFSLRVGFLFSDWLQRDPAKAQRVLERELFLSFFFFFLFFSGFCLCSSFSFLVLLLCFFICYCLTTSNRYWVSFTTGSHALSFCQL